MAKAAEEERARQRHEERLRKLDSPIFHELGTLNEELGNSETAASLAAGPAAPVSRGAKASSSKKGKQ